MRFMWAFDALFVVNARSAKSVFVGRCAVFFALLTLVVHLAALMGELGLDVVGWSIEAYPLALVDNNRSVFGQRAGVAVLVVFPLSVLFAFLMYTPRRSKKLLSRANHGSDTSENWRVALYTCSFVGTLMASVPVFGAGSSFGGLAATLTVITFSFLATLLFPSLIPKDQ